MRLGTRRLLALTIASPRRSLEERLDGSALLTLAAAPHENIDEVWRDVIAAALDALVAAAGGPAWDEPSFAALHERVGRGPHRSGRDGARATCWRSCARAPACCGRWTPRRCVRRRWRRHASTSPSRWAASCSPASSPRPAPSACADVERYLQAAQRRLSRLPDARGARPRPDAVRARARGSLPRAARRRSRPEHRAPESLRELPWLLQELRVHCFAEGLTRGAPVTTRRVRRALDDATVR